MLLLLWDLQMEKNGLSRSVSSSRCDWDSRLPLRWRRCCDEDSGLAEEEGKLVKEKGGKGDQSREEERHGEGLTATELQ